MTKPSARDVARLALISCLALPAGILWAQNENETVGFQSNHIFAGGHFGENIDILNGGLNLSTPIGQAYQVNQNLSYQLNLNYTSKIWDLDQWDDQPGLRRRGPMGLGHILQFGRI